MVENDCEEAILGIDNQDGQIGWFLFDYELVFHGYLNGTIE